MNPPEHWYVLNLGDALLAADELDRIKTLFQHEYASAPGAAAIFIRHESDGQLHCDVKLYFAPDTATLAHALCATPCPPPPGRDLGLFAGDDAARAMLDSDNPENSS